MFFLHYQTNLDPITDTEGPFNSFQEVNARMGGLKEHFLAAAWYVLWVDDAVSDPTVEYYRSEGPSNAG